MRTELCSWRLCPSPGMYEVTSMPFVRRTRATLRSAELGFFGVVVYTRVHTPRFCGQLLRAGEAVLARIFDRPFLTSWLIVGIRGNPRNGPVYGSDGYPSRVAEVFGAHDGRVGANGGRKTVIEHPIGSNFELHDRFPSAAPPGRRCQGESEQREPAARVDRRASVLVGLA